MFTKILWLGMYFWYFLIAKQTERNFKLNIAFDLEKKL